MDTRQDQDLELWREWKRTGSTASLERLLTRLQPLIYREVSKWQAAVPQAALEAKAKLLAAEALRTYDPSRGAAIGTHITSRLRKLSRSVYPYQNIARLPENKQLMYNTFTVATNQMTDTLGREPTVDELADNLAWTSKKVQEFKKAFGMRELVESAGVGASFHNDRADTVNKTLMDFFYHGLPQEDKDLFADITGYGGRKSLSNSQLISKYRISQGQLSYKRRKYVDALMDAQKRGF